MSSLIIILSPSLPFPLSYSSALSFSNPPRLPPPSFLPSDSPFLRLSLSLSPSFFSNTTLSPSFFPLTLSLSSFLVFFLPALLPPLPSTHYLFSFPSFPFSLVPSLPFRLLPPQPLPPLPRSAPQPLLRASMYSAMILMAQRAMATSGSPYLVITISFVRVSPARNDSLYLDI